MLRHPSGQVSGHPDPSKETLRCSSEDKSTCGSFLEQGSWGCPRGLQGVQDVDGISMDQSYCKRSRDGFNRKPGF